MTIDECREYLPESWLEPIQNDPVLWDIFSEHEYDLEEEAVPPFLIQELRGGNMERLRPILALYGQPGLELFRGLLEIDEASKDTAEKVLPDGQTAYAAYFFARFDQENKQAAIDASRRYIQSIRHVYETIFEEPAPVDADPEIQILTGQEGRDFQKRMQQECAQDQFHPSDDLYDDLGDWFRDLDHQGDCGELADLFHEALYHISNDFFLSFCLQWPLLDPQPIENPFQPYFELWKMGLEVEIPEKDRVVLIG